MKLRVRRGDAEIRTVYDLLDEIRRDTGLLIGEPSITVLWGFIHGFMAAGRVKLSDAETPEFSAFHDWIAQRLGFGESTSGWRRMLLASTGDEETAFDRFFAELDAFRRAHRRRVAVRRSRRRT